LVETMVAVAGVALTYGLPRLTQLVVTATSAHVDDPWTANIVRFVTAFGILLVPATAMGATLPLLVGALARWRADFGSALGRAYGWNTLGAVAGVVVAEVVRGGCRNCVVRRSARLDPAAIAATRSEHAADSAATSHDG
jgi:hypothetical protein